MRHLALCISMAAALMAGRASAQTASTLTEQLSAGRPFVVVARNDVDRTRFICGGAHSTDCRTGPRLTPENHSLVILGQELKFDDAGKVCKDEVEIGVTTIPPAPYQSWR